MLAWCRLLVMLTGLLGLTLGNVGAHPTPAADQAVPCHSEQGHSGHDDAPAPDRDPCAVCCGGFCAIGAAIPARSAAPSVALASVAVAYCATAARWAERSLSPDPAPPRPIV